ncbi:Methyltransferase domain-containing protein [Shimia gijangensis]|uniref:Methyltransferase domain-containing protein n=1 Tax=Shimia gijangensis TaxID=1470563 RepID=A0A1M6GFV3_9RHOB|nr:methyltransferase domain-containing protein [Shimia gijangensis]SHJ08788.1 Methyltransferase domain-containing protein [Shimia gijangensis]
MSDNELHYDNQVIHFLEDMWGDGFLSPGGAEEATLVVEGLDLRGKTVLDIGSGSGAIAVLLAGTLGAKKVIGIDVEEPVVNEARQRAAAAGLSDRIDIQLVEPGPFPFPENSFDIVYSKDSIIHIPDKETLSRDVYRVLRPGGWFAASDWLISHDNTPSPEMQDYITAEDLDFAMASPGRYTRALADVGFSQISLRNRNPWYREVAAGELNRLTGPERSKLEQAHGETFIADQVSTWSKMMPVLKSGEHCPHHIRGQKPS